MNGISLIENVDSDRGRPIDDPEYCAIMCGVGFLEFVEFMKDKDIFNIRLPVNNPEAYKYLRWLNEFHCHDSDGNYLNYILNIWDKDFTPAAVRPPTPREEAIYCAKRIVDLLNDKELNDKDRFMDIDFNAEFIRDAYRYWSYPDWIRSGLAGCVMKWGTFEDNLKPGDKYMTYEEFNS